MNCKIYFPNLTPDDFQREDKNNESISLTYGEIFPGDFMNFMETYFRNLPNPYMLDVGSGCGRFAEYVSKHGGFAVDGIEIDKNRHEKSLQEKKYNTHFIHDDFENISFHSYNILYCCNACFDKKDNHRLYHKILNEFKGLCILFEKPKLFKKFFHKQYYVKTSWNLQQEIYLIFM